MESAFFLMIQKKPGKLKEPGPWFNIKTVPYQCRNSRCADKMILRPCYLHNGIFYPGMTTVYIESGPRAISLVTPIPELNCGTWVGWFEISQIVADICELPAGSIWYMKQSIWSRDGIGKAHLPFHTHTHHRHCHGIGHSRVARKWLDNIVVIMNILNYYLEETAGIIYLVWLHVGNDFITFWGDILIDYLGEPYCMHGSDTNLTLTRWSL